MTRQFLVYTSTVVRGASNQLGGFLYCIDWSEKRIINRVPIPVDSLHPSWNSRGGNRGGRGVQLDRESGILYVATASEILKYSMDLRFLGTLNHYYMAGLHEILLDRNSIWVVSTVHDLVFQIGLDGQILDEWWGSTSSVLRKSFPTKGRSINVALDFPLEEFEEQYEKYCNEEEFHFNALAIYKESVFVLSNAKNALLQIMPSEKMVFIDHGLAHPHNLMITSNGKVILNDTGNQRLKIYDLSSGINEKTISTPINYTTEKSEQFAKAGWQRGLSYLESDSYIVGSSPAQLFEINTASGEVYGRMVLDENVRHCIHGLLAVDK